MNIDEAPDERRGRLRFECHYCDKTWRRDTYNEIRYSAARHFNEEHGDDLSRAHERLETETRGGHHVHENEYVVTRIDIYLTPFDFLQPAIGGHGDYLSPASADNVCSRCGQIVNRGSDVEKVEDEPDSVMNDDWTCSTCLEEQEIESRHSTNRQLGEFA